MRVSLPSSRCVTFRRVALAGVRLGVLIVACALQAPSVFAQPLQVFTEESPPANFMRDGELTGLSVEMVREIQRRLQDETPIQIAPWARGYQALQRLPNVALFSTTRTPAREAKFHWVGPLLRVKWVLYAKKNNVPENLNTLDDARRVRSIGAYHDDARERFLLERGFTNLQSAANNIINVKKLMSGRLSLVAGSNVGMAGSARAAGYDPKDLTPALVFKQVDLYIAFSKQSSPDIVARWRDAFQAMVDDGTYARIYAEWLPDDTPPVTPSRASD